MNCDWTRSLHTSQLITRNIFSCWACGMRKTGQLWVEIWKQFQPCDRFLLSRNTWLSLHWSTLAWKGCFWIWLWIKKINHLCNSDKHDFLHVSQLVIFPEWNPAFPHCSYHELARVYYATCKPKFEVWPHLFQWCKAHRKYSWNKLDLWGWHKNLELVFSERSISLCSIEVIPNWLK